MNVNVYGLIIEYDVYEHKCNPNSVDSRVMYLNLDMIMQGVEIGTGGRECKRLLCENGQD